MAPILIEILAYNISHPLNLHLFVLVKCRSPFVYFLSIILVCCLLNRVIMFENICVYLNDTIAFVVTATSMVS